MIHETTPYGVREVNGLWEVWQEWWDRKVGGPFDTREEAEADAIAAKRTGRTKLVAAAAFYVGETFWRYTDPPMRGPDGLL